MPCSSCWMKAFSSTTDWGVLLAVWSDKNDGSCGAVVEADVGLLEGAATAAAAGFFEAEKSSRTSVSGCMLDHWFLYILYTGYLCIDMSYQDLSSPFLAL